MSLPKIKFYNRYNRQIQEEKVMGEKWLKFLYSNPFGKLPLELLIKRKLFSKYYGMMMTQPDSAKKILPFIDDYEINTSEFSDRKDPFRSFDDFFTRKLNVNARPIAASPDKVIFPADGRHLAYENISEIGGVYIKGQQFNLRGLFKDKGLADHFGNGSLLISRLCPTDYHRFHFPAAGTPSESVRLKGPLYSVNPIALRSKLSVLWTNERQLSLLKTRSIGTIAILEIGATCVGAIHQTYTPDIGAAKGSEKGYFSFGGSCVITIFEKGQIRFAKDILEQTSQYRETFARMGDTLGVVR